MEVERKEQVIVVSLSADEVLAVQAGRTVGDRPTRANLPREAIETPMTEDRKGYLLRAIPNKGITVNFGGSLQVVDVGAENY